MANESTDKPWIMGGTGKDGECAARVLDDMSDRAKINGHVILFANEKGGVGKSTLAFHSAIELASAGHRVLTIDLDPRQKSLARTIENRHASAICLGADLPTPISCVLDKPSGAMLVQEICRIGADRDIVIIDAPGHDLPVVRRAAVLADTLVTPVNASFFDLDVLGRFDPVTQELREAGPFSRTMIDLRAEQARRGKKIADWIVVKNRVRACEKAQLDRMNAGLDQLASALGLRLAVGLRERVAYRSLLQFGLDASDLGRIPQMGNLRLKDHGEMARFIAELNIPEPNRDNAPAKPSHRANVPRRTRERFAKSLQNQLVPDRALTGTG